ncbi:hypothetical protein HK102_011169 [Quaeritorhiza haematococci]|nr:hypothetical protein HK102_011169 [Quaeritorhiza haematococci]
MESLRKMSTFIDKSFEAMSAPPESSLFPNKECDPKHFNPELTEDMVVDFHINNSNIVVSMYMLNFHQAGLPLQFQSKIVAKFKALKLEYAVLNVLFLVFGLNCSNGLDIECKYKGRPVEIVDEINVESPCAQLHTMVSLLNVARERCRDVLRKLDPF